MDLMMKGYYYWSVMNVGIYYWSVMKVGLYYESGMIQTLGHVHVVT